MIQKVVNYLRNYLGDVTKGLERFCGRYYGIYPAIVIDNKDPDDRCRIRATCPAINMPNPEDVPRSFWALPCMPGMGNDAGGEISGMFHPPDIGTVVWYQFEFGDSRSPVYMGGLLSAKKTSDTFVSDDSENIGPSKRGIRTRAGHFIRFNDDPDNLEISIVKGDGDGNPTSQMISMTKEGHTYITNKNGSMVYMNGEDNETTVQSLDSSGNVLSMMFLGNDKITISTKSGGTIGIDGKDIVLTGDNVIADCNKQFNANAGQVKLGKNATQPLVRGTALQTGWGIMHTHPCAPPGSPSGPSPLPLILKKELSDVVYIP